MKIAKVEFKPVSTPDDPEKLLIPGIIWINKSLDNISVYYIAIGWWHYALTLKVAIIFKEKK